MSIDSFSAYSEEVKRNKKSGRLHSLVENRLARLLTTLYPEACPVPEISGILGGRNDLIQFFFNGRRVVFELFFSPGQVPQDLRLLEQSAADVKIAILLDPQINPTLSRDYFRKKPDAFPFVWLRYLMMPEFETACLARLQELIDDSSAIRSLRRIMSMPGGMSVEKHIRQELQSIEARLSCSKPEKLDWASLTPREAGALLVVAEIGKLGVPLDKVRGLYAWLREHGVSRAGELVSHGFQTFLITDLDGGHAILSDSDLADDLIMGAEASLRASLVVCVNRVINILFEATGLKPCPVRWHFFHSHEEFIEKVVPKVPSQFLQRNLDNASGEAVKADKGEGG